MVVVVADVVLVDICILVVDVLVVGAGIVDYVDGLVVEDIY